MSALADTFSTLRSNVVAGRVLDEHGAWVPREELVSSRRTMRRRLAAGEVMLDGAWVTIQHALDGQAAAGKPQGAVDEPPRPSETPRHEPPTPESPVEEKAPVEERSPSSGSQAGGELFALAGRVAAVVRVPCRGVPLSVIKLAGHLDHNNAGRLDEVFSLVARNGHRHVALDLTRLEYSASAGWGTIAAEAKRLRSEGGELRLFGLSGEVESGFRILQFDQILPTDPSEEHCVAALRRSLAESGTIDSGAPPRPSDRESPAGVAEASMELEALSLEEKVKRAVAANGPMKFGELRRVLASPAYGSTRIGMVKLYRGLRAMGLETEAKRKRYYRSC